MVGRFDIKNRISGHNQNIMSNAVFDRMSAPDTYNGDPFDEVEFSFDIIALSSSVDFADNFSDYLFKRTKDLNGNERNAFVKASEGLVKQISYLLTDEEDNILSHIKPESTVEELGIDMHRLYGGIFCSADKKRFYDSKNVADIVEAMMAKELVSK